MSVAAVRDGLNARLATIPDLHTYARTPKTVNLPAAVVEVLQLNPDTTLDGTTDLAFGIVVLVADPVDDLGQEELDAYMAETGARSIIAALDTDPTLGGACDDIAPSPWSEVRPYEMEGGLVYYGAQLAVSVYA